MAAGDTSAAKNELSVLLLGTPEMRRDSQRLEVRRRQVRALLYYLAQQHQPVPRERLAFLFWPDLPEADARRNLTRLLSAARAELGDGEYLTSIQTQVALHPQRVWSDCGAFEQLLSASDGEELEQAVTLYRGRFLDGFSLDGSPAYGQWQDEQQRYYERRYLDLLLRLVDLRQATGDLTAAIDYARRYLASDELAEEVHRRLIALYAANGDRSAAARQFEACTLILERELGVRPLPETRAAFEAALAEAPALPAIAPTWSVLPSLDLPLTGREEAWQQLSEAHRRLQAGGLLLISGEPGIGKSRLMQEFATASGSFVLTGNNPPGAQAIAYTAVGEALRQALGQRERWQGIRPIWLAEAGRLLPEISDVFPDLPPPVDVEPSQAQARLFEGLSRCFLGLATHGPLLLCLDDLHWADPGTIGWLSALPQRLAGSNVCVLATNRIEHAATLADLKHAFARPGLLAEVPLTRLRAAAVSSILNQLPRLSPDPQPLADRIHEATGGNTFFVLETLRVLLEAERLDDPPDHLPLAPTVEAAIRRRLDNLSPLGRQVLETAAVLAPDLRLTLLQETAGRFALEVAEGLDEVVGRQLLVGGETRRFSHDLVRQVAYEEISAWRRRILHRRAAEALERVRARDGERTWATIGSHYDRAGDVAEAIRCYEQAALAAQQLYAHEEAIHHLRRAVELASEAAEEAMSASVLPKLHEALADNLAIAGEFAEAEEAYRTVLAMAGSREGDPLRRVELERKLASTLLPQQRSEDAETIYRRALERLDGQPPVAVAEAWRSARLDILLGLLDALYFQFRPEAMAVLREQTQELLDAVGTAKQFSSFYSRLNQMAFLRYRYRAPAENIVLARRALARAEESGSAELTARQRFHLGFHLLWHGDYNEAENMLRQALSTAEALGDFWLQNQCLVYSTILYRLQGDSTQVAAYLPQLVEISQRIGHSMYVGVSEAHAAWLHYQAGEWQKAQAKAAAALATWAVTTYPFQWLANWILLALAVRQKRLPDAVAASRAMLDSGQQQLPDEVEVVLQKAVTAWEAGDKETARAELGRAVEVARQFGYL